jgi:hypothetical protein
MKVGWPATASPMLSVNTAGVVTSGSGAIVGDRAPVLKANQ